MNRISFQREDYIYPNLEPSADEIAQFILSNQIFFEDFCEFLRYSGSWKKQNCREKLISLRSLKYRKKSRDPRVIEYFRLIEQFFYVCNNDNDIKKMRGLVPEKLLEKIFTNRYLAKKNVQECGCSVSIEGNLVRYICPNPFKNDIDSDDNKLTVDVGIWDGQIGEFTEIKVSPDAFHTKDIKYLRLLAHELTSKEIQYKVYLVALQKKDLTQERLVSLSAYREGEFELIGREEVFELSGK